MLCWQRYILDDHDCNYSTIVENCNLELDEIGILKNSIPMLTANALSVTYTSGKGTFGNLCQFPVCSSLGTFSVVFCYQNCSDLLWEKNVLVIEKNLWNSRLKAENLKKIWDHQNNLFEQWKVRTILGNRLFF